MLWPLRRADSAIVNIAVLPDGRRRIKIRHAELKGVTPEMLAWWFGHIEGEMLYAGRRWPRYLVWHPRDHVSYDVVKRGDGRGNVVRGARLHVREAFQRDPRNLLDVIVTVEHIDSDAAIIGSRVLGASTLRLCNCFQRTQTGTRYASVMTIGSESWLGRCGLNWLLRSRILAGNQAHAWVRHHIEEVGNLENFPPAPYAAEGDPSPSKIGRGARRTAA